MLQRTVHSNTIRSGLLEVPLLISARDIWRIGDNGQEPIQLGQGALTVAAGEQGLFFCQLEQKGTTLFNTTCGITSRYDFDIPLTVQGRCRNDIY